MDGAIPLLPLNTFRARAANVLPDIGYWRGGWIGDSADWAIYRTEADWAIYKTEADWAIYRTGSAPPTKNIILVIRSYNS